jgi:hypothetical protein
MIDAGEARTIATSLIGLRIQLRRTIDVPCRACGGGVTVVVIGPGAGPHVASLHCAACDRHRGWLPKTIAEFLLETISRFGRPREPITIQDSEFAQLKKENGDEPNGSEADEAAPELLHDQD